MSRFRSWAAEGTKYYPDCSLYVTNIDYRTTEYELYQLFNKFGEVVKIYIPRDRRTGDCRGFVFVRYKNVEDAVQALESLNGARFHQRYITVQFARTDDGRGGYIRDRYEGNPYYHPETQRYQRRPWLGSGRPLARMRYA
jgi:RNA recognition motif-containing protein